MRAWTQELCVHQVDWFKGLQDVVCPVQILRTSTYTEGVLVYLRVRFVDVPGFADGFGFRGANGSGWGEETHPFSSPSYGKVTFDMLPLPGGYVDYPFNHDCGTRGEYESDVEFWIHNSQGQEAHTTHHLKC